MPKKRDPNPFDIRVRNAPKVVLSDYDTCYWDPLQLLVGTGGRDPSRTAMALADGFCKINRPVFKQYGITAEVSRNDSAPRIRFVTTGVIGAFPLRSPVTGQYELPGIIEPWIDWSGVGPMLSAMGMKIVPELVRLPVLPRSAKEIPSWVIGSIVVKRLEALLNDMVRKYSYKTDALKTPRGHIDWQKYATEQLSRFNALNIPCEFPVLENNGTLMSVIHFTLRKLRGELEAERRNGSVIITLIAKINELLTKVSEYAPIRPSGRMFEQCFYSSMDIPVLGEGLESVRWCAENRGLGGLSDLNGLAWRMDMPAFFEAYVETIVARSLRYSGGRLKADRLNQTRIPIYWQRNRSGMMGSLRPDIVVLRNNQVVIVDAKFKRYGMLQQKMSRAEMAEAEQDAQRHDIHQIIAYSACYAVDAITACLVYPTSEESYKYRLKQGVLHQYGKVNSNGRVIDLVITYIPLRGNIDAVAKEFSGCICRR